MLRLTIEAQSVKDLYAKLEDLCDGIASSEPSLAKNCFRTTDEEPKPTESDQDCAVGHMPVEATQELPEGEPEEEPTTEPEAPQEAKDEPQGPTAEEVRTALNELRKSKGTAAVKEILKAHGAENFPGLDKTHYAAVLKEAEADAAD